MKLKKLMRTTLLVLLILSMATGCGLKSNDDIDKTTVQETETEKESDKEDDIKSNKSSNNDTDNIELYKNAIEKTNALDGLDMVMDMDMQMTVAGEEINTTSVYNMQINNYNDLDEMEFAMSSVNETMGQTYEMNIYYKDGYLYSDLLGNNSKAKVSNDEAVSFIQNSDLIDYDLLKDVQIEESGEDTIFSFTCDEDGMQEYLESANMDSLSEIVDNINYSFDKMEGTVVINSDGYVKSQYISFDMSMKYELSETEESTSEEDTSLNIVVSINVDYNNPGEDVTVEFPDDLDSYSEVDVSAFGAAENQEIDEELMTEISEAE